VRPSVSPLTIGGIFTLEDLRTKKAGELTPEQVVGLKYFEELQTEIPREEMDVWNVISLRLFTNGRRRSEQL
jgi:hypothetical protein